MVSAPPGSGKTVLLRSWISQSGVAGRSAWVPAGRGERDPQRFWLSVLAALRQTGPGSVLVREVTAAPDLDGWVITERLLADLAPLDDRLWLVVDDVHELGADALRQLELLIMRAPPGLRFVLAAARTLTAHLDRAVAQADARLGDPEAGDVARTLADRGPTSVGQLLEALREAGADDAARTLADHGPTVQASLGNPGRCTAGQAASIRRRQPR
jgi:LuxR family maltose regulon positive regulatory protein